MFILKLYRLIGSSLPSILTSFVACWSNDKLWADLKLPLYEIYMADAVICTPQQLK